MKATIGVLLSACFLMFALAARASEPKVAPEHARSDDRYKADILLIVPHADDDTAIAGYLARATFDEHRRVAAIYITGNYTGENRIGSEVGKALGAEREIEARQALGFFGVRNIWFLNAPNMEQNVLLSLESMDHGSILAQVVRLIRLTRPEIIMAFLPLPVAGEDHADHQAASVIATEAFDLAGDPSAFAEQLTEVQNDDMAGRGIFNYYWKGTGALGYNGEGLHPWQPKKIYYFSDAFDASGYWWSKPLLPSPYRKNFLDGVGPVYSNTEVSPAKQASYARLSAQEESFYLTQEDAIVKGALGRGDFKAFEFPTRFVLGKSLVGGSVTGDVFENITPGSVPFMRPPGVVTEVPGGGSLELGGPWGFYREFWKAHALERVADLLPIPETAMGPGQSVEIPLVIRNDAATRETVTLSSMLPHGWVEEARYSTFPLPADGAYAAHRVLTVPAAAKPGWYEVMWKAEAGGRQIGTAALRIYVYQY